MVVQSFGVVCMLPALLVSMLSYWSTARALAGRLIPVPTEHIVNHDYTAGADAEECAAYYPEDVADYGGRGW